MYWSRKYRIHRCNASKQWGRQYYNGIPKSEKNKKCVSNLPNCNVMTHGREGKIRTEILPNNLSITKLEILLVCQIFKSITFCQ